MILLNLLLSWPILMLRLSRFGQWELLEILWFSDIFHPFFEHFPTFYFHRMFQPHLTLSLLSLLSCFSKEPLFLGSGCWIFSLLQSVIASMSFLLEGHTYTHSYISKFIFLKHHFKKWYSQLRSNTTGFILASSSPYLTPFSSNNKFGSYLFTPIILFCLILEYMN